MLASLAAAVTIAAASPGEATEADLFSVFFSVCLQHSPDQSAREAGLEQLGFVALEKPVAFGPYSGRTFVSAGTGLAVFLGEGIVGPDKDWPRAWTRTCVVGAKGDHPDARRRTADWAAVAPRMLELDGKPLLEIQYVYRQEASARTRLTLEDGPEVAKAINDGALRLLTVVDGDGYDTLTFTTFAGEPHVDGK